MISSAKYDVVRKLALTGCKLDIVAAGIALSFSTLFPDSNEAAIFCGCFSIAVALVPVYYAVANRDFTLAMNCLSLFTIAPVWFLYLEAILPGYDAYVYITPEFRMVALFWISVFMFVVNGFYLVLEPGITNRSIRFFSFLKKVSFTHRFYINATFISFLLPLVVLYFFYGSFGELWTALTAGRSAGGGSGILKREAKGDESALLLPLTWIWQLVPVFGSLAFIEARKKAPLLAYGSLAAGLCVIFITFLGGSRGGLMQVAAPCIFFLFYYNWNKGLKFWLPMGGILLLSIGIMELQVRFRGNLLEVLADPAGAARERGLQSATSFDATETHRDNNMYLFGLMVEGYPSRYDYEGFNDFFATIVNPVPRAFWPDKPVLGGELDISQQHLYIARGPRQMGTTSLSVSVVGNAYITAGVLGIALYAFIYACFLAWFDGLLYYRTAGSPLIIALSGISIFLSFWGFRDFFALVSFIYPLAFLILFIKIISRKRSSL